MTENKRFTLEMQYWKDNPQGRKLFDNLTGQDGMSVEELCNIASDLHSKCEELESVLKVYEDCLGKLEDENKELKDENEQLKKEKEFWRGDSCNYSNYLSILSMDCQIVQEAIYDLKNVIDVDTEAFKLLDELDDKFDELNQHRIKMYSR